MPYRIVRVVARRLNGRRGRFLLVHAVVFAAIGYSYLIAPATSTRMGAFAWLLDALPLQVLGWPWLIAAVVAVVSAASYDPPRSDRAGFVAITSVPLLWGMLFGFAWVAGFSPTAWISAVTYIGYALIVMVVASWPNPIDVEVIPTPPPPPRSGGER